MSASYQSATIAATDLIGGEYVVLDGDVFGPVLARFPRTQDGYNAAVEWMANQILAGEIEELPDDARIAQAVLDKVCAAQETPPYRIVNRLHAVLGVQSFPWGEN